MNRRYTTVSYRRTLLFVMLVMSIAFLSFSHTYDIKDNRGYVQLAVNRIDTTSAKLTFSTKVIDFGSVDQDTVLYATYYLRNPGNSVLHIYSVKPDCTCTDFEISNNNIMPGDSASINLMLNTRGKYGKQKIYAIVHANTIAKFYKLTMKVNIDRLPK